MPQPTTSIETEQAYMRWLHLVCPYTLEWLGETPLTMTDIPWRDWYDSGCSAVAAGRKALAERHVCVTTP